MIDYIGQMLAQPREQFVARQPALRHQAIDLVDAQGAGEIAGRDLLVRTVAYPGVGRVALAVLLELLEQVTEPAAEHASRSATREQAAQSALEDVAKTATHSATGSYVAGRRRRARTHLGAAEMLDRLPGQQSEDRHGHRR